MSDLSGPPSEDVTGEDDDEVAPLPISVQIDAWPGEPAVGALEDHAQNWGSRRGLPPGQQPLAFDEPVLATEWESDNVGYGVLLADTPDKAWAKEKVTGAHAPAPIQQLLAARPKTQLLYWNPDLMDVHLRRYYDNGQGSDLQIGLTTFGIARNRLPRYILIVGTPEQIPWSVQ